MSKKITRYWLLLLGLQLLVCGVLFAHFISGRYAFAYADIGSDSYFYFTPLAMHFADYLRSDGMPGWSFRAGLGGGLLRYWDPFLLLTSVTGRENVLGLRIWAHVLKILFGGGFFFAFLLTCRLRLAVAVIGALAYSFCGYLIIDGQWDVSSTEFVFYALLLWASARAHLHGGIVFLPAAIAVTAYSGVFVFSVGIFLLCVFVATLIVASQPRAVARQWMYRIWPQALIGLLLAGPLLVPCAIQILDNPRVTGGQSHLAENLGRLFSVNDLQLVFSQIAGLFHKDIVGVGNNHHGWWNYLESPGFYVGVLPLILVTQLWRGDRLQRRSVGAGLLLVALYFAFPALRSAAYGFQLDYFRVSSLWISILLLILFARSVEFILDEGIDWRILGATTGVVAILLGLTMYHFEWRIQRDHVHKIGWLAAAAVGLLALSQRRVLSNRGLLAAITLFVAVESVLIGYPSLHEGRKIVAGGTNGYKDGTIAALDFLRAHDKGFYRIEKTWDSVSLNDALAQGYMGIKSYLFHGSSLVRFYIDLGLLPPTHTAINYTNWLGGFRNRFALDSLVGVKYVISRSEVSWSGFTAIYERDGIKIYRNEYALPLGVVYERQLPRPDFLSLPDSLKDFALLHAVVLDSPIGALGIFDPRELVAASDDWFRQHYAEPAGALQARGLRLERFGNNSIAGHVDSDVAGVLAFSIPFAAGWSVRVDGAAVPVLRANLGMLAVNVPKGSHVVELQYSHPGIGFGWALAAIGALAWVFMARTGPSISEEAKPRSN